MAHSNQVREFVTTGDGVELLDVHTGPGGVLTGASRIAQAARDQAESVLRRQAIEARQRALDRRRRPLEGRAHSVHEQAGRRQADDPGGAGELFYGECCHE